MCRVWMRCLNRYNNVDSNDLNTCNVPERLHPSLSDFLRHAPQKGCGITVGIPLKHGHYEHDSLEISQRKNGADRRVFVAAPAAIPLEPEEQPS